MQPAVRAAIDSSIIARREILQKLTHDEQSNLLEQLLLDSFHEQHLLLQKWATLTGQSAQLDTGYISQFIASLLLREPGQGFRGKGDDLADGSEVKSAASISGVDRPRWNHNMGTPRDDADRIAKGTYTRTSEYLNSPYFVYVLVDRAESEKDRPIRVRSWCIDTQNDSAWKALLLKFAELRTPKQYNLQLHPPVGDDNDLVVNSLGNLDFSNNLVFDARITTKSPATTPEVRWKRPLPLDIKGEIGRTKAIPYGTISRRTRLSRSADLVLPTNQLSELFSGVLDLDEAKQLNAATREELTS